MTEILEKLKEIMHFVVFDVGGSNFTVLTLLYLLFASLLLVWGTRKLSGILDKYILGRRISERGTRLAIVSIIKYISLWPGSSLFLTLPGLI